MAHAPREIGPAHAARAEQVAPRRRRGVGEAGGERDDRGLGRLPCQSALLEGYGAGERGLLAPGGGEVRGALLGHLLEAHCGVRRPRRSRDVEGREQAVALAQVPVEVGQRRHVLPVRVVADDEGEPEPQLGEPDGHGIQVHAEQVVAHDRATPQGSVLFRPALAAQPLELGERLQQKRAGADGGIEDADRAQRLRRRAVERDAQRRAHRLMQQLARREVGARAPAATGRHEALEHPAEHLGIHGVGVVALAYGEVEPLEQVVEQLAPHLVGQVRAGKAALDRVALEQPAVQERHAAEGAGGAAPRADRGVERAEAQRLENRAMEGVAAATERCVEERR